MTPEKRRFFAAIFLPLGFTILIWLIKIVEVIFNINFIQLGIFPGKLSGLIGIFLAPLIHSDFSHLFANTLPLIMLGTGLFYFYKSASLKVFLAVYFISGILVWFFARSAYHIGASGLIYGFVSFLFFSGIIRRDNKSIALALLVTFLYGSLVWGVLPIKPGVSFESHLFGALTGIAAAFVFRKLDPPKKYDWEDEPVDDRPEKLEIRYDR